MTDKQFKLAAEEVTHLSVIIHESSVKPLTATTDFYVGTLHPVGQVKTGAGYQQTNPAHIILLCGF